ncbi:MAG: S-adenosylmethionine:tRNA ribosyltransferase-isomerase [Bacteroidales bacterium]|nr:S-adenosylmethionine:tRNA ribosyltransferase-isomerase [Bacteroidales bacterium]
MPGLNINIDHYNYDLPDERIAKYPLRKRDESKLLIYDKGNIHHEHFRDLPGMVTDKDMLVYNNTRVIQARIHFIKSSGANIEIFCLEPVEPPTYELAFAATQTVSWKCLIGNAKRWRQGELIKSVEINEHKILLKAIQNERLEGEWIIQFEWKPASLTFSEVLDQIGKTPIPPYLNRESESSDKTNYQTVYSRYQGSVAAPTAGLHFTDDALKKLLEKRIPRMELTLHVGAGTFRPVIHENVSDHSMHSEHIYFGIGELEALIQWPHNIIAVGTTTTRTLESVYWLGCKVIRNEQISPGELHLSQWEAYTLKPAGKEESLRALLKYFENHKIERFQTSTEMMIVPGYEFRMVDKLITNFHQPQSTLLLLVGAFIGEDWRKVYRYAMENEFRFLSYGDSSMLMPNID